MKSETRNQKYAAVTCCFRVLPVLAVVLAFAAMATGVPPTPVEELARRADAVVHGRVKSLETARDGAGRVFTRVELDVAEVWKGTATNRFSLVLGSGVLGDRWVRVVGEPEYRLGEEVVVFTVRNPAGDAVTLDLAQGKFAVTSDASRSITSTSNGVFGGPSGAAGGIRMPHQVPLSLDALRERVSAVLTKPEASR